MKSCLGETRYYSDKLPTWIEQVYIMLYSVNYNLKHIADILRERMDKDMIKNYIAAINQKVKNLKELEDILKEVERFLDDIEQYGGPSC